MIRNNILSAYFISNTDSKYFECAAYQNIMQYIIGHQKRTSVKEINDKVVLQVKEVSTVTQALDLLREMNP